MTVKIIKKLSKNFESYNLKQIEGGASKKNIYKLWNMSNSYILLDFSNDKKEYHNYIKVYEVIKNINISTAKIIEKNDTDTIIVTEDLGKLRYDKILTKFNLEDLLTYAVETLIIIKNSINYSPNYKIPQYGFEQFKDEITELPDYFFPYKDIHNKDLHLEFNNIWFEFYKDIDFEFKSFIHKDFNINNLIFLPNKKNYLKCGVIDFQNAFWGESSWDLFSLLEDSRILFSDRYNKNFIKYFHSKTNEKSSLDIFFNKYNFLNSSRQTRLLGRWIKLFQELNDNAYLEFIPITLYRLKKSIELTNNKKLIKFYRKYIFVK